MVKYSKAKIAEIEKTKGNGDRDYTPHHHNSGGYALIHRWL